MRRDPSWRIATRARLLFRGLRYAALLPVASLDGSLSVDEAIALFELSRSLPHEQPVAVGVGTHLDRSGMCLARGLTGKFRPRLCCIDAEQEAQHGGVAAPCADPCDRLRSVLEAQLPPKLAQARVEVRRGISRDQARDWQTPIDLLFLDAAVEAASSPATLAWMQHVRPGGLLALRSQDIGQPQIAARLAHDPNWVEQRWVGNMLVTRRVAM